MPRTVGLDRVPLANVGGAGSGTRAAHRRVKPGAWFLVPALALVVGATIAWFGSIDLLREGGPVEQLQILGWGLAVWVGWFGGGRRRSIQARLWLVGMGTVASAALARELDLHIALNPETLGAWGVRYRIDWWLDAGVPALAKLAWGAFFLVATAALFGPLMGSHVPWSRRFRGGWVVNGLLGLAVAGIVLGWATDDIFRDAVRGVKPVALVVEESVELMGAWAYFACLWVAASRG